MEPTNCKTNVKPFLKPFLKLFFVYLLSFYRLCQHGRAQKSLDWDKIMLAHEFLLKGLPSEK
jgi:hypothetical protein